MLKASAFALAIFAASTAHAQSCLPSIVTPADLDKLTLGAWTTAHSGPHIRNLIGRGDLVVMSKEALEQPDIAKVIAEHLKACLEKQRTEVRVHIK